MCKLLLPFGLQAGELSFVQLAVNAVFLGKQLGVGTALLNSFAVHDDDFVCVLDGGQTVRNHEGGAVLAQLVQRILNVVFGHIIQRRGRFVQNQDWWIFQKDPCNRDALLLSAGQLDAALADEGVVALRQGHDVIVNICLLGSLDDLLAGSAQLAVGDVVKDGSSEQEHILLDDTDLTAQRGAGDAADVFAVNRDLPPLIS